MRGDRYFYAAMEACRSCLIEQQVRDQPDDYFAGYRQACLDCAWAISRLDDKDITYRMPWEKE